MKTLKILIKNINENIIIKFIINSLFLYFGSKYIINILNLHEIFVYLLTFVLITLSGKLMKLYSNLPNVKNDAIEEYWDDVFEKNKNDYDRRNK